MPKAPSIRVLTPWLCLLVSALLFPVLAHEASGGVQLLAIGSAGSARPATSRPAGSGPSTVNLDESVQIVDQWTRQLLDGVLDRIARKIGRRGSPGLELALEGELKVPVYGKFLHVRAKAKRKIIVNRNAGQYDLTLMADGELGAGVEGPRLAQLDRGAGGRVSVTFQADPRKPGEMTRLFWLLVLQEHHHVAADIVEKMQRLSPSFYDKLARSLGVAVRTVARVGAAQASIQRQVLHTTTQTPAGKLIGGFLLGLVVPGGALFGPTIVETSGQLGEIALARAQETFEVIANHADVATRLALSFKNAPAASRIIHRIKVEGTQTLEGELQAGRIASLAGGVELALGSELRVQPERVTGLTAKFSGKLKGVLGRKGQVESGVSLELKGFDVRKRTLNRIEVVASGAVEAMGELFPELPEAIKVSAGTTGHVVLTIALENPVEKIEATRAGLANWRQTCIEIKRRIQDARRERKSLRAQLQGVAQALDFKWQAIVGLTGELEGQIATSAKFKVKPTIYGMYGDAGWNLWDIFSSSLDF